MTGHFFGRSYVASCHQTSDWAMAKPPPTSTRNSSAESAGQEEDHPSLRAEVRR
jgi:hypothetical protein